MARANRYVKLTIGIAAPLTAKTNLTGAKVVGQWNEDGRQVLMLERAEQVGRAKAPGAKRKTNAKQPVAADQAVANG